MHNAERSRARGDNSWYSEVLPSPDLAPWIAYYRFVRAPHSAALHGAMAQPAEVLRVLPDGSAGLVVDCLSTAPPIVLGAPTTATLIPLATGVAFVGVRFRPGAAVPFVGGELSALTGRRFPLPLLWGGLADQLVNELGAAEETDRVAALERALRARLREHARAPRTVRLARAGTTDDATLVARAAARLGSAGHEGRVREVAAALGVGERRLERVFDRAVGVGPKLFARMRRVGTAARLIRQQLGQPDTIPDGRRRGWKEEGDAAKRVRWAALAAEAGFVDQPHLIRDFTALAGVTPVAYARERRPVGFLQYTDRQSR